MKEIKVKDLLTKKPFARITPEGYLRGRITSDLSCMSNEESRTTWRILTQGDFLREFYPTGHKINSEAFYPNRIKYDEEQKKFFEEKVFRAAFPFQMIITIQQLVHLCGNDIQHELTMGKVNDGTMDTFLDFKQGWLEKNMEIAFYELGRSAKITGDGAIVYYLKGGKLYYKVLSYLNGDTLYPHYDDITGELNIFARKYSGYDDDGEEMTSYVEVWDDTFMYRYKRDEKGISKTISKVKEYFGLDGYVLCEPPVRHGFTECPIVYHREQHGPCWSFSQDNIDKYELAISHLCQNNMAYAFPIMVLKGDDVRIEGDMYGAVKAISMGKDDDAGFMKRPESTQSFELQINTLLKMIFMGSFTVMPPEVKSGDLPGVAIKLIYSPSLEKAIIDAKEYDRTIDRMSRLFKYGYGVEKGQLTKYLNLSIMSYIEPYVHENGAELINNLVQSVNSGILSHKTASTLTHYGQNSEWDNIMREKKEEDQMDLLNDIKSRRNEAADKE